MASSGPWLSRVRVVAARGLRQAGQERGLRQGQLGQVGDAEVVRRRRLDAIRTVAVVDQVEVGGQDPLLAGAARIGLGHLGGHDLLADLVLEAAAAQERQLRRFADVGLALGGGGRIEVGRRAGRAARRRRLLLRRRDRTGVLDDLLGDRGGTLHDGAGLEVGHHRAADALQVDAVVRPEGPILARHGRVDDDLGKLVEGDGLAVLAFEARQQGLAGAVVDVGRLAAARSRPGCAGQGVRWRNSCRRPACRRRCLPASRRS